MSLSKNNTPRVFVTGSRGFIGKNLSESFKKKYYLFTPSHKELDLLDANAVDKYFRKNRIDIVIHLADRGGRQFQTNDSNVLSGNLRIFFNLKNNQSRFKRLIFVGSGSQYGKQLPIVKVNEQDLNKKIPEDDFGFYKYIAANYIEHTNNFVNLCVFGIYGKYEDWRFRFISNTICKALYEIPITINNNCYFDFIYIDDFKNIVDYFVSHDSKFNTYNVSSGKKVRLDELARKIVAATGKNVPVMVKNKTFGNEYTCSNVRLKKEIKNIKFTTTGESLNELINWYRKNLYKIDKTLLNLPRVDIWDRHKYNLR